PPIPVATLFRSLWVCGPPAALHATARAARLEAPPGRRARGAAAPARRSPHPPAPRGGSHVLQRRAGSRQQLQPRRQQLCPQTGRLRRIHRGDPPARALLADPERGSPGQRDVIRITPGPPSARLPAEGGRVSIVTPA